MLALAPPPSTTAIANFPEGKAQMDVLRLGLRYLFFWFNVYYITN